MGTQAMTARPTTAQEREKRAVGMVLTFTGIGNRRKVSVSQIDVTGDIEKKTDKAWLAVSKKLIDAEELDAIASLDGEIRQYIETRALPSNLKKGIYLLPVEFIEEVNGRLTVFADQRKELVEKLIAVYADLTREAQTRLDKLFNSADYLTREDLACSFRVTWQYVTFDTPASLATISTHLYEEEKKKAEAAWKEASAAIQELLRVSMAELVDWMVDKLTPAPNGKQKVFRDSSIEHFQDFLATFNAKNITDDAQLKVLVDRAKSLVGGIKPDRLRDNWSTRDTVRSGFESIKKALDPMIIDRPKRAISFED